ncbi:hypothetical protein FF1_003898 [Malus domestica]
MTSSSSFNLCFNNCNSGGHLGILLLWITAVVQSLSKPHEFRALAFGVTIFSEMIIFVDRLVNTISISSSVPLFFRGSVLTRLILGHHGLSFIIFRLSDRF